MIAGGSQNYGLRKDQLTKYYEIIEKDPEGKLNSLRTQYTAYLKKAVNDAINADFSDKSLDALQMTIKAVQDFSGSYFDFITESLKSGDIVSAADYMYRLQVRLDSYKRTGKY